MIPSLAQRAEDRSAAYAVAVTLDLVRVIVSFTRRLQDDATWRACCRTWRHELLDSAHPTTRRLFKAVEVPFSRQFGLPGALELVATAALRELRAPGAGRLDESALVALGHGSPGLRMLDVSRCEGATNCGLAWLAYSCRGLVELDVSLCPR